METAGLRGNLEHETETKMETADGVFVCQCDCSADWMPECEVT